MKRLLISIEKGQHHIVWKDVGVQTIIVDWDNLEEKPNTFVSTLSVEHRPDQNDKTIEYVRKNAKVLLWRE